MLSLRPDEIHLWFLFCDQVAEAPLLASYRRLLSDTERQQEQRFHAPAARHRYLLTRALTRTTLSRYVPLAPEDWAFARDRYGRPHIANRRPDVAPISFNISHSGELVLLAVTRQCALGVDVEAIGERTAVLELADRYFSKAEASSLRELPPAPQRARFFDHWTLKEAYIKARGQGLSLPLDQFRFTVRGCELHFEADEALHDTADRWRFWLIRPAPAYVAAVCAQRWQSGEQTLIARAAVPLRGEESLAYAELGRSP